MRKFTFIQISVVTSALLFSFVDAEIDCSNTTCANTTEPNSCADCSDVLVPIALISLAICLLPPITWGLVIWWACHSDPTKRLRRQERRRRVQEAAQRMEEQNEWTLNDLPPSYENASNFPLYQPKLTRLTVVDEGASSVSETAGAENDAFGDDKGEPPPSYAFVISGAIVSQGSVV
ncbi:uncharacterized protein [Apostichopus japonicus]|uniref:uncharacterized protein isoform X1 n=1 Tax=Stichopus japonicus TaxID=307972 RepID=UPI003AB7AC59